MEFQEALALAKSRSDCAPSNLDSLVALIRELDAAGVPGHIVECGSYKCGATVALAAASPDRVVWAFDLFGGAAYPGEGFENFRDADLREIQEATEPFWNIILVVGRHEEMVPKYRGAIALLFLDSDFYESHLVCLQFLWPQLSPGAVVVFHDPSFEGVQKAIRATEAGFETLEEVPGSPNMKMIRLRQKHAAADTRAEAAR